MSIYYKYNFVSPEPIYATVKEVFKSYFDTGAVDDLLFPTLLDKALKKLGNTSYPIAQETLFIENFTARLPDNFYAAREAWFCTEVRMDSFQTPNSYYSQTSSSGGINIIPLTTNQDLCSTSPTTTLCPTTPTNSCTNDNPDIYKVNFTKDRGIKLEYLLKPGNISAHSTCSLSYNSNYAQRADQLHGNPKSSTFNSFDIRDNKFVTNFRTGIVHLLFYAENYDNNGNQLMPDNYRIREYLEAFLKYQIMETLVNQINDETFNQLQQKLLFYKQLYDEAYIMADIEIKKETVYQKQGKIKQTLGRLNMYELPTRSNRNRRRN